jgi:hypothetical protein
MLIATMALTYVIVFFVAALTLFKRSYIPVEDLALNFMMIMLVFLAMPALSNLLDSMRSLLSINVIDVGYVAKRLKRLGFSKDVKRKELAIFLASHLHFSYVGIALDDKLHSSKDVDFTLKDIEIGAILNSGASEQGWWALKSEGSGRISTHDDLRVVIDLRDGDGLAFGKIIFGAPHREDQFSEEDFMQLDMIVSLVATAIGSKKRKKVT